MTGRVGARIGEAEFQDMVGAIYEVALAPQDLPDMLSRLVGVIGALWAPLSVVSLDGGRTVSLHNAEGDPAHLALFNTKYVTPERNPATPLLMAARPGQVLQREHYFSDSDWEHREVYQEVYRPIGAEASLGVVLVKSSDHFVPLGLMRPKNFGSFTAEDLVFLARVVPHLSRMMQILLRLNGLEERTRADETVWDQLPHGVILLDETGRLLWANRLAEALLSDGDGLGAHEGFLCAANAGQNAALQALIGNATATGLGRETGTGGGVALTRSLGRRPLSVLIAPLRIRGKPRVVSRRPVAVAFLSDPDRTPRPPIEPPHPALRPYGAGSRAGWLAAHGNGPA